MNWGVGEGGGEGREESRRADQARSLLVRFFHDAQNTSKEILEHVPLRDLQDGGIKGAGAAAAQQGSGQQ